ncbi:hypothetical protein Psch_04139 [Pelotomaculum schinkii]|uniref:DUF2680 domain-containing protein n=2 Tax=Pelotomaculum TaxID=191373 RepID=A0A4Y7R6P6_9FIRM|nr:DUF2680 domain-containing protein [Pelotomaculum schinkii]TEB04412.1 hypothetical protein Psch_04139 [Pelotomaculum schinkii]
MINFRKLLVVATVAGVLGAAGAAYAATAKTPAEITAELTGKTVSELYNERAAGKTYGTIANEAGKLDEFKTQMLEQKKIMLDQRVEDGRLTQEQADNIYNNLQNRQAACNGNGNAGMGKNYGAGFGQGKGIGNGTGVCDGSGMGNANGKGNGNGSMKNGEGMGFGHGLNR